MRSIRHRNLFLLAVLFALFFHFTVLYHLHDLPLQWATGRSSWTDEDRTARAGEEIKDEKEKLLAQAFKALEKEASSNNFAAAPVAALSDQIGSKAAEELTHSDASPSTSTDVDVVFTPSAALAEERAAAAEKLLGEVELQLQSLAKTEQSLNIGSVDRATDAGDALDNHSGIFQQMASTAETPVPTGLLQASLENDSTKPGLNPATGQSGGGGTDGEASIASSNDFTLSMEYAPTNAGPGGLFRITLKPKSNVLFKRIRHNVFFLIDRSSSISNARYDAAKAAVRNALGLLREGDRFNILIFDDKVAALTARTLVNSPENLAMASGFLDSQPHGGLFAATDLYGSLGNLIPEAVSAQEVNSVILFSDGETLLSPEQQRQTIARWTAHNAGKVSLFSVAVGKGNNLPLLDLLTASNKGLLEYTKEREDTGKALFSLLHSIRTPIGKEIVATAVPDSKSQIYLYPPSHRAPHLYLETPYVIYGMTDNFKDFYLFLQGRYYDKWLDIKQKVAFEKAMKVPIEQLEHPIALQQAYDFYEFYLHDGDRRHLGQVNRLLRPFGTPTAFQ